MKNKKIGFTIIEIFISLAILGLLSGVALFITNPTVINNEVNDHKRVSDVRNIAKAIDYLDAVSVGTVELGNPKVVYLSLPDNTSATCSSYSLPALPSGYTYSCKNSVDYKKNDGNGWIPITLQEVDNSLLLSAVPVDPVNNELYYYSYFPGSLFEITTLLTKARDISINDGGLSPTLYEVGGTDRMATPILRDQGLLAYYSFDSGDTESVVFDHSGSNNTGNWNGLGEKYDHTASSKKVAKINGENDFDIVGLNNKFSIFTFSLWVKIDTISSNKAIMGKWSGNKRSFLLRTGDSDGSILNLILSKDGSALSGSTSEINSTPLSSDGWYFITVVYKGKTDGSSIAWMYVNGEQVDYNDDMVFPIYESDLVTSVGSGNDTLFPGKIDEIRLYSRILGLKEIKSIYDKTKGNYK